ncbi:peptidase inhibitor family I36 protein [Streptomyces sp. NPDC047315]|uniref:peptidase inhibitor family I36 protein n=1 Tax=Streptomyces sp. NPDC047315 TaxID=3155142 RepID=UPI00340FB8E7
MKNRIALAASAAIAALGLMALPQAAQADDAPAVPAPKAEAQPPAAAADGHFYLYNGYFFTGARAGYFGNASNYGSSDNTASSLWNNGYPGALDDVRVYLDARYAGPSRGIHNGVALADLQQWRYDGTNRSLDNSISSHKWVDL